MAKEREYEVDIFCDGMEYPDIATLSIIATSPTNAIKWVKENMRYSAQLIK